MENKTVRMVLGISLNLLLVIIGVFLVFEAGSKAYTFGHNIFDEESISTGENATEVQITITDGESVRQLASILYQNGLIEDKLLFYFQAMLSDYKDEFVGGTYTLSTAMTPTEMMKVLCNSTQEE